LSIEKQSITICIKVELDKPNPNIPPSNLSIHSKCPFGPKITPQIHSVLNPVLARVVVTKLCPNPNLTPSKPLPAEKASPPKILPKNPTKKGTFPQLRKPLKLVVPYFLIPDDAMVFYCIITFLIHSFHSAARHCRHCWFVFFDVS
jgi:hypothetical protein